MSEHYQTAKEIAAALGDMGLRVSDDYVRALWRAGAPHVGRSGLLSELLAWWKANPDVRPRSVVPSRRKPQRPVESRGISVL